MSFCTSAASFATTTAAAAEPTFHTTSSTKRGCDAVVMEDDTSNVQHERNHKRIKISSSEATGSYYSPSSFSYRAYQPIFQAPFAVTIPSGGSPCFTDGGEFSQTKKRGRSA